MPMWPRVVMASRWLQPRISVGARRAYSGAAGRMRTRYVPARGGRARTRGAGCYPAHIRGGVAQAVVTDDALALAGVFRKLGSVRADESSSSRSRTDSARAGKPSAVRQRAARAPSTASLSLAATPDHNGI